MTQYKFGRRAALLGAAGLLSGCETFDDLFGDSKKPLPGKRVDVFGSDRGITADPALNGQPVTLPAPVAMPGWPMPGGTPNHAPGNLALGSNLSQIWRSSIGEGSAYRRRITTGPVIAGDLVYTADADGVISAHGLERGDRRWRFDTRPDDDEDGAIGAGCAVDGGVLYVVSGLAEVLALDAASGKLRWRARIPATGRGAPAVAGDKLILPTIDNQVLALSTTDGKRLWSYQGRRLPTVPLGLATPALDGDMAIAGLPSGELVVLRVADGRVVWTESVAGAGATNSLDVAGIHALPVVADGRVFAIGMGGTSIAVDLRSGRRLWEREMGGTETPVLAGDWLFSVTDAGLLVAVGRDDGRFRWVTQLNDAVTDKERERRRGTRYSAPILANGQLILPGSREEALVVDAGNGAILNRISLPGPVSLPAAVAGNTVVMLTDDGTLVAYRAA